MLDTEGAVKALIGGRSYADSQYNRAVTARRQPGFSAFKPFIYLTALEHGLTPETVREDARIQLKGWRRRTPPTTRGPVTLTTALALSLNTVSVRLTLEMGPKAVVATARRLGIASPLDPNPSIALGTSEVSVLELASAYVPFANGGIGAAPHVIDTVRGPDGKVLYQRPPGDGPGRVMDPAYAGMMNRMMTETLAMGTRAAPICRDGRRPARPAPAGLPRRVVRRLHGVLCDGGVAGQRRSRRRRRRRARTCRWKSGARS